MYLADGSDVDALGARRTGDDTLPGDDGKMSSAAETSKEGL